MGGDTVWYNYRTALQLSVLSYSGGTQHGMLLLILGWHESWRLGSGVVSYSACPMHYAAEQSLEADADIIDAALPGPRLTAHFALVGKYVGHALGPVVKE